jgi:hypothetical protein
MGHKGIRHKPIISPEIFETLPGSLQAGLQRSDISIRRDLPETEEVY